VYNRSETKLDEFKTYASGKELNEGAYKVVKDLHEIGKT
jgi:hypothetical protein